MSQANFLAELARDPIDLDHAPCLACGQGRSPIVAHLASISIGPTTCLSPDGITTTHTLTITSKGVIANHVKELATREDLATAQQIAWWESVIVARAPKFSAKPRLAHCTGLVSEWSLVSINGRWSIQLEVWTLGSDRKSSVLLPKDRNPQDVLDQLDGLLVASTVRRAA